MRPYLGDRVALESLAALHDAIRDLLRDHRIAHEAVRSLADEDLVRRRRLFEALRHCHCKARDDEMTLKMIACHHLAAVDLDRDVAQGRRRHPRVAERHAVGGDPRERSRGRDRSQVIAGTSHAAKQSRTRAFSRARGDDMRQRDGITKA